MASTDTASYLAGLSTQTIVNRLEQVWRFLREQDAYRYYSWTASFKSSSDLFVEAQRRRQDGDAAFTGQAVDWLEDCLAMQKMHQRYHKWISQVTPFTTAGPLKLVRTHRLIPYGRQLPVVCIDEADLPSTRTSLVPRSKEVTDSPFVGFPTFDCDIHWKNFFKRPEAMELLRSYMAFYQHADLWGQQDLPRTSWTKQYPLLKNPDNPDGQNLAQYENVTFETCVGKSWSDFGLLQQELNKKSAATGLLGFAIQRGIRRAAIQKLLGTITNSENRDINSPWRRVAFPLPPKKFHHSHYHALTLPRREKKDAKGNWQSDHHVTSEPSPWIYWFNEWRRQAEYISAWTRQSYNKRYWSDYKRIALPINFRGPYSFGSRCVYDDYWLKAGQDLVTLQANLDKLAITHTRWLLDQVIEDIRRGENGEAIAKDVIPRADIDLVKGKPDKYQLIDEVDVAWLKFLCQPPSTKALSGLSHFSPEDTLTILLDHRLQTLFNDSLHNPFWLTDTLPKSNQASYRPREIQLEHLLPMINMGGRDLAKREWETKTITWYHVPPKLVATGAPIPNSLYQFSLKEAKVHCTRLAEMGRITYKRPEDPDTFNQEWWSGKGTLYYYPHPDHKLIGGSIAPVPPGIDPNTNSELGSNTNADDNPVRYPEERIRWRYESESEFQAENARLKDWYATEMVTRNRAMRNTWQYDKEAYEAEFLPEIVWKEAPYFDYESTEFLRESPGWEDILDYRTVVAKDVGYSFRTINFLRNLAYRMGRTIRHYRDLKKRVEGPSALSRAHLHAALDDWKVHVDSSWDPQVANYTAVPFKLGNPSGVIELADKAHMRSGGKDATTVFKRIREGIIDDMVRNRTMLFPGRRTVYVDKSRFMGEFYERANIWSWGREAIRQRHAVYRRERYFDMRRWPVNRQPEAPMRTRIIERLDEDPGIQPVSAFYKYNIKVGPSTMVPENSDVLSQLVKLLGDPEKIKVANQMVRYLSKEIVKIVQNTDNIGPGWEIRVAPPGTRIQASSSRNAASTATAMKALKTQLKPMIRPKQRFIPGPAVFPMGDTLLQQVKMSHDLEMILDPKPTNTIGSIVSSIADWLTPPPERVPLVPDIDLTRAPSSTRLNLKRKVNTAFITPDGRAPKRQAVHTISSKSAKAAAVGRGALRFDLTSHGSESDSDMDLDSSTGWTDFDYIIPPHPRHTGPNVSSTSKKEDGTWKIKIDPDLDDVMDSNMASTTKAWGGYATDTSRPPKGRHSAPKPDPRARHHHVHSPIIQDPSVTSGTAKATKPDLGVLPAAASRILYKGPSKSASALVSEIKDSFNKQFPRGVETIPTSGNRLLCALFAIIESYRHQYPGSNPPSIDQLYNHHINPQDADIRSLQETTGFANRGDLSADQAAAALLDWSLSQGCVLQLGVWAPESSTPYMRVASDRTPLHGTIWIQSNIRQESINAMILAERVKEHNHQGALTPAQIESMWAGQVTNHYSGLKPL